MTLKATLKSLWLVRDQSTQGFRNGALAECLDDLDAVRRTLRVTVAV